MYISEHIGRAIARAMGDMPVAELARRSGLNRQQLHRYLKGEAVPRADAFMRICMVLNVDPAIALGPRESGEIDLEGKVRRAWGNAQYPSEAQFASGVYDIFSGILPAEGRVARVALMVGNEGGKRPTYLRVPGSIYPARTPARTREVRGPVLMKFGQLLILVGYIAVRDQREQQVIFSQFGPPDLRNGKRTGITSFVLQNGAFSPIGSKSVLIRSREQSYARAFRRSGLVALEAVPDFVREFFLDESATPFALTTTSVSYGDW